MRMTGTTARFKIKKPVYGISAWAMKNVFTTNDPALKAKLRRLPDDHVEEIIEEKGKKKEKLPAPPPMPIEELGWYELVDRGKEKGVFRNGMKKSELIAALKGT